MPDILCPLHRHRQRQRQRQRQRDIYREIVEQQDREGERHLKTGELQTRSLCCSADQCPSTWETEAGDHHEFEVNLGQNESLPTKI